MELESSLNKTKIIKSKCALCGHANNINKIYELYLVGLDYRVNRRESVYNHITDDKFNILQQILPKETVHYPAYSPFTSLRFISAKSMRKILSDATSNKYMLDLIKGYQIIAKLLSNQEEDRLTFNCSQCGHPNNHSVYRIPIENCYCFCMFCNYPLFISDSVSAIISSTSPGSKVNSRSTEFGFFHKRCIDNAARKIQNGSLSRMTLYRNLMRSNVWKRDNVTILRRLKINEIAEELSQIVQKVETIKKTDKILTNTMLAIWAFTPFSVIVLGHYYWLFFFGILAVVFSIFTVLFSASDISE
jgi:hypothetical protein